MLNKQLLNFGVKIQEEDKATVFLSSLPLSYNHLVTTLLCGTGTLMSEEVNGSLLSHKTEREPINDQADRLVEWFEPKRGRGKFKEKNDKSKQYRSKSRLSHGEESWSNAKDVVLLLSQESALQKISQAGETRTGK